MKQGKMTSYFCEAIYLSIYMVSPKKNVFVIENQIYAISLFSSLSYCVFLDSPATVKSLSSTKFHTILDKGQLKV